MSARSIRFALEYALARAALATVPRLPRRAVVGLANFFGATASVFARHLRKVARANLDIAFHETKTPAEKKRIIRSAFQSFTLVMLDMFWFAQDSNRRIRDWVDFDPSFDALFVPRAHLCITAHMGNWEVLGMSFSTRGFPMVSVAAPLANRKLDGLFCELRQRNGQQILSKHGAVRGLLKTLKNGGKVALVLDQNTKPSAGGIFMDFFGLPVPVSSAPATLALRTGAQIFVGVCLPTGTGRYRATALVPIPVSKETAELPDAERKVTGDIVRALERLLREHPEHWLWMYKRWKYIAPGRSASEYPFYAKQPAQKDGIALASGSAR